MDFCDIRLSLLTILRLAIAYLSCFVCGSVIAQDKTLFGVNQINLSRVRERESGNPGSTTWLLLM